MRFRNLLGALLAAVALSSMAAIPAAEQIQVVEFYHAGLDHYFVSANVQEISDLDTGVHPGWVRTGYTFPVIKTASALAGTAPMCRFYAGSFSSHFYTAKAQECEDVKTKFPETWLFESPEVFRAFPVAADGTCPADTTGVYRLWNQRADVNHRYTTDLALFQFMVAKGYKPEGDGNPNFPLVYCAPTPGATVPAPSASSPNCTVTASSGSPALGSTVTLNAICTNNATSYMWTGCTSTTASCTTTQSAASSKPYTLYASNNFGPGQPVTINVNWGGGGGGGGGGGAVPVCTVSASTSTPVAGTVITLTQNCNNTPTKYNWQKCDYLIQSLCNAVDTCPVTANSCQVTQSANGFARYAIVGENASGQGPRAAVDVEWQGGGGGGGPVNPPPGGGGPAPVCEIQPSTTTPIVGTTLVLSASCSNSPTSYNWSGVACSAFQCGATSSVGGTKTYTLTASNGGGTSPVATLSVDWQSNNPTSSCTLTSSNPNPQTGQAITLTATCTNSPLSYAWTGCTANGTTCTSTNTVAGNKAYSVVATNAVGPGPTATLTLNWTGPPTSPPACTLSATTATPAINTNVTLSSTCTGAPTGYSWSSCAAAGCVPLPLCTGPNCTATAATAGVVTYFLIASNSFGAGPAASAQLTWGTGGGGPPGGGPDFCGSYGGNVIHSTVAWGNYNNVPSGAFASDGVWVVAFTVPAGVPTYPAVGYSKVAEFQGEPAARQMTLSKGQCDFRDPDPTGVNGPFDVSYGFETQIIFQVGGQPAALVPGQTYYFNIRNYSPASGGVSCSKSFCNAVINTNWPH